MLSTSLGKTFGFEVAIFRVGKLLKGIFENDGSAMHTCVDSGS